MLTPSLMYSVDTYILPFFPGKWIPKAEEGQLD